MRTACHFTRSDIVKPGGYGKSQIAINGGCKTDFAKALWENPKLLAHAEATTPLRRIGEPEDIAGAAVFLASKAGAWMTGHQIVIDGGITIAG